MATTFLVTGGTGFLGRHVVRTLLASTSARVRVLARHAALDAPALRGLGEAAAPDRLECVSGSVLDPRTLRRAVDGCDAVFHLAGRVLRGRGSAARGELRRLHVDGTRALLRQASDAGARRVVYASTSGTIACARTPAPLATEDAPRVDPITRRWPYYATKIEAEREARARARELGVELVTINPSLLLGPGDVHGSSTGDVARLLAGRLPALPSGGLNFVDARDAAAAAVAALERGDPGARYLLGAVNWSCAAFFRQLGALAGVAVPRLRAPDLGTRVAAHVIEPLARACGRRPPLDVMSVEMSQVFWYFDAARARARLGFAPRDPDDTLRDTIADLRARPSVP